MRRAVLGLALLGGLCCSDGPSAGDCNYLGVVPLDFGEVAVGQTQPLSLTIDDLGRAPISFGGIWVDGGFAADFTVGDAGFPSRLQPGNPVRIGVTFEPSTVGVEEAELEIAGDGCVRSVSVTGTGIAQTPLDAGGPTGNCNSMATLDFGDVVVGFSGTLPLELTNCGPGPALVPPLLTTGAFSLATAPPLLLPNESVTLEVTFTPTAAESDSATLSFSPCDGCSPMLASLSGTGLEGAFSCQTVRGPPGVLSINCSNTGSWLLELYALGTPGPPDDWALSALPSMPAQIAPGQGFTFIVTPLPADGGGVEPRIEALFGPPGLPPPTTPTPIFP